MREKLLHISKYLVLLLIIAFPIVISCNQQKKLQHKIDKSKQLMNAHPLPFAEPCARLFPPLITTDSSHTFHPGKVTPQEQSADVDLETLLQPFIDGATYEQRVMILDSISKHPIKVKIKCPDCDERDPDTIKIIVIRSVENTARVSLLTDSVAQKNVTIKDINAKFSKEKHQKNYWMAIAIVSILLFIIKIVFKLLKK